jgi:hypothetical protein
MAGSSAESPLLETGSVSIEGTTTNALGGTGATTSVAQDSKLTAMIKRKVLIEDTVKFM